MSTCKHRSAVCQECGKWVGDRVEPVAEMEKLKAEAARAEPVLAAAIEIGKWWRIQDGIAALALEELADAVKVYLGEAQAEEPEE